MFLGLANEKSASISCIRKAPVIETPSNRVLHQKFVSAQHLAMNTKRGGFFKAPSGLIHLVLTRPANLFGFPYHNPGQ
jgi:hypothetical protein